MSLQTWLQNLCSAPRRGQRKHGRPGSLRAATHRLHFESLEDRRLLAFLAPVDYAVDQYADDVKAGDFNGDAVLDLAAANWYGGTVSVHLGNADGTFQPAQTSVIAPIPSDPTAGPYPQSVAVGDFNADGKLDLAASTYDYYGSEEPVRILFGNGDGTFAPAVPQSIGGGSSGYIATGDLNADGKVDLVVTSNNLSGLSGASVKVMLGQGDGSFSLASTYSGNNGPMIGHLSTPVLADFNRDGNTDVAVPASGWQAGLVKVYLGNGDGTLQAPRNVATYSAAGYAETDAVKVGDFNGDGRLDLVTLNRDGSTSILLGNGDGSFQAWQSIAASGTPGDVNGDGALDLVSPGASVFLGNGDGSFAPPITPVSGSGVSVLADFNADGRLDAAGLNSSGGLSVLINDGAWPSMPPAVPQIGIKDVSKMEGANNKTTLFTFTVTLSAVSNQVVTVNYATANGSAMAGSDYLSKTGTVTFAPGETSKTITISVKGDKTKEPDETFYVNLAGAKNGTISDGQGVGTILNDDGTRGSAKGAAKHAAAVDAALQELFFGRSKSRRR